MELIDLQLRTNREIGGVQIDWPEIDQCVNEITYLYIYIYILRKNVKK